MDILNKQFSFLEQYNLDISKRSLFFSSKTNLKLTVHAFLELGDTLNLKELLFKEQLTIKEIRALSHLNKEVYYVSPNLKKLFTLDKTFVALYTIFNGDNKAIF